MAHDVSLTYTRFDHMSPTAVGLATLLHGLVAAAMWWVSPLHHVDQTPDVIEITMEQVPPPPAPQAPPPPEPPPAQAAPPPPPPPAPQTPPARLGLRPPIGTIMDPRAPLSAPPPNPTKPETPAEQPQPQEAAKPEPAKPEPAKTEPAKTEPAPEPAKEPQQQQQAALAPQPPPPPQPALEKALPPVEAPPPPLTSREIPRPAPPPPPPKPAPQPAPRAQTPQQQPSSPLSHIPQQRPPAEPQQAARPAPSPLTNPADIYGQRKTQEDYLWGVVRKISQHRYYPKSSRENSEEGVVVARITVARDGRLIEAAVARSSGYPTLDNALIEVIRQSAPYPPLPSDMSGDRHTFLLPLNYRRTDQ